MTDPFAQPSGRPTLLRMHAIHFAHRDMFIAPVPCTGLNYFQIAAYRDDGGVWLPPPLNSAIIHENSSSLLLARNGFSYSLNGTETLGTAMILLAVYSSILLRLIGVLCYKNAAQSYSRFT